ncbi:MAG: hypothetical protein ACE5KT_06595 [Methanosarcinales archaeon]
MDWKYYADLISSIMIITILYLILSPIYGIVSFFLAIFVVGFINGLKTSVFHKINYSLVMESDLLWISGAFSGVIIAFLVVFVKTIEEINKIYVEYGPLNFIIYVLGVLIMSAVLFLLIGIISITGFFLGSYTRNKLS